MRKRFLNFTLIAGASAILFVPGLRAQDAPAPAPEAAPEKPAAPAAESAPAAAENPVVVTVDGTPITQSDVDRRLMAAYAQQLSMAPPEQQAELRHRASESIIQELINRTLLGNAAKDAKVEIPQGEVDARLEKLKASLPPGQSFDDALKTINLSEALLRDEITMELGIGKLLDEKIKNVPAPTDEAMQAFYNENGQYFERQEGVQASHILIGTQGVADEAGKAAAKKEADEVRAQLVGENPPAFAELAKQHSTCPSKDDGGNLGEFGRSQMVKEFEDAAFTQKVDEVGPVVETEFGYHIIKVTKKVEAGKVPFDEAKEKIGQHLKNEQEQTVVQDYLKELRASAKIVPTATTAG